MCVGSTHLWDYMISYRISNDFIGTSAPFLHRFFTPCTAKDPIDTRRIFI